MGTKNKKPIIAVDIDDVLFPANKSMMHFVNKHFGTKLTWKDYQIHAPYWGYWEAVWNVSKEEAQRRYNAFVNSEVMLSATALNGAISVIEHLEKKYDLIVVTARGDEHIDATHTWLTKHFPETFKRVEFIGVWSKDEKVTKAQICNEVGAKYLIDDNVEHCVLAAEVGVQALLFGYYGWNYHEGDLPDGVKRVKTWQDVKKYFDEKR